MGIMVVLIVMAVVYEILGRMMIGKERRKIKETSGKMIYQTGTGMLAAAGVGIVFTVLPSEPGRETPGFWTGFITVLLLYQAAMEQVFLRDARYPVTTLLTLALGLVCIALFVL
ncbi:hypothetical protein [Salibacterium qingdaonense]|uniref:DUF4181 domain-containing protein n=1 Tax=Salibacterium qingdaonense TaxID=266892 RepID=A0A1I4LJY7_9BACI|nr:hypothetical protein [Salibacterium qingdaonense]SFL91280.1 hypothetical protein SAMN04488054_10818 [Salibacterium qingdaonense]